MNSPRHRVDHPVFAELTLTSVDADELAAAGSDWLVYGLQAALSEEPWDSPAEHDEDLFTSGLRYVTHSKYFGVPENSYVAVDHWGEELRERPISESSLSSLPAELRRHPVQTTLRVGSTALTVMFEPDWPTFVKLGWEVGESNLRHDMGGILRSLWGVASKYNPVFGHISYGNMGGRTELERNLPPMIGNPYRNTPRWQEFMRGYSWWNIMPGVLAQRVGGTDGLRNSGAFEEILELPGGAVWLRATREFAEYDAQAVDKVWRTLKDVSIPADPRPAKVYPGDPPNYMTVFCGSDA